MAKISNNNTRGTVSKTGSESMPLGVTKPQVDNRVSTDVIKSLSILGKDTKDIKSILTDGKLETKIKATETNRSREKIKQNNEKKESKGMKPKEDSKSKEFFKDMVDGTSKVIEKNNQSIRGAMLGGLNVIFAPFEEFFGGSVIDGMKNVFGKAQGLFSSKKGKKAPNESDVAKIGVMGTGFLYLGSLFSDLLGIDKKTEGDTSFMSDLMGGLLGKGGIGGSVATIGATIGKALPIAGLIGGIIWAVVDGISGFFKSGEWGVSGISGIIGGVIGGTDKGLKGAFKGMGKWALIGAGIGSIFPVVGTLVGGLVGAGIGAIVGWIGGEKIANFFEPITQFFKDTIIPSFIDFFMNIFNIQKFIDIWKGEGSIGKKIGQTLWEVVKTVLMLPINLITESGKLIYKVLIKPIVDFFKGVDWKGFFEPIWNGVKNFFSSAWTIIKDIASGIGDAVKETFMSIVNSVVKAYDFVKNSPFGQFVSDLFTKIGDAFSSFWTSIKESPFGVFMNDLFSQIGNAMTTFLNENPVGQWIDKWIISPIVDFFSMIGDFFSFIGDMGIKGLWNIATTDATWTGEFEAFQERKRKEEKVDDAIIKTDGTIIRTHPDDNIIATKNLPTQVDTLYGNNQKDLDKNLSNIGGGNSNLEKKVDTMIELLSQILNKKEVNITMPKQTRQDLDLIMSGGMI